MKNVLKKIAIAAAIAGAGFAANATPILGKVGVSFGFVEISFGEIDWNAPLNNGVDAAFTFGDFTTTSRTLSFSSGLTALSGGSIQDLSQNPADANYVPVNGGSSNPSFLKFNDQAGWLFKMNKLASGSLNGVPNALLPFALLETSDGNVSATISVSGIACDAGMDLTCDMSDSLTKWTGIFSTTYTSTTIAEMFALVNPPSFGTLPNSDWSGNITATSVVPEPGSLALLGLGLVGLAASRRRSVK